MIKQIISKAKTLPEELFTEKYREKIYSVSGSTKNCIYTVVEGDYMVFIRFVDSKYYEHQMMIRDQFNRYKNIQVGEPGFID